MSLLYAREVFTKATGELLVFAYALTGINGCSVILCECQRSKEGAAWNASHCRVQNGGVRCERKPLEHHDVGHTFKPIGSAHSVHLNALAVDILIMREGTIVNEPELYAQLAVFWKRLDDQLRWGGDFEGFRDLGHFSHRWNGRE